MHSSDAVNSTAAPEAPARTKLVFLYSSEEDEDEVDHRTESATDLNHENNNNNNNNSNNENNNNPENKNKINNNKINKNNNQSGGRVRTAIRPVLDSPLPDAATLAALSKEAEMDEKTAEKNENKWENAMETMGNRMENETTEKKKKETAAVKSVFSSDYAESLTPSAATARVAVGDGSVRMVRVAVVDNGLVAPPPPTISSSFSSFSTSQRLPTMLKRLHEGHSFGSVKRFREADSDDDDENNKNNKKNEKKKNETDEEVVETVRPIVAADGATVVAISGHGYTLSLDETDFMDPNAWTAEEEAVGEKGDDDDAVRDENENENDEDDDADEDDDEDEEDEDALDDVLFIAIVEQLVRCCEAEDLDPDMSIEAARFLAEAKPCLAQLEAGSIEEKAFSEKLDRSVRRFQRIYQAVYRPRDCPIVVDGVKMDM